MKETSLNSINETIRLGKRLGSLMSRGDLLALSGELGSGKTTFIKGVAQGLRVKDARHVNSPSFVIVKEYEGKVPLYHFDVYRLDDPSALNSVGYKEYFYGDGVTAIEWADKIGEILPEEYLGLEFRVAGDNKRGVKITPRGARYERLLKRLRI